MFYLDKPKSDEPTFIFFQPYLADGRLKYPVSHKVHPDNWEKGTHRIKRKQDTENVNAVLRNIETAFEQLELDARTAGKQLTKAAVTAALDKCLGRKILKAKSAAPRLFEGFDIIIADRAEGRELNDKSQKFSEYTIRNYKAMRKYLFGFDSKLSFETITIDTHTDLIVHLGEVYEHSINMIGTIIKDFKALLKAAKGRGWHSNLIYADELFYTPEEETDAVTLDQREIDMLYKKHFNNETLDLARDWFIIDCFTGLRISDLQLLDDERNLGDDTIHLVNEKTNIKVAIPLHPYVKAILRKWKGFPPKVTDQELNRSIKECCELTKINDLFVFSITKGGVRRDFYYKKWQKVSNHTARRTFITALLEAGMPDNQVMQLAGIKKHTTLLRYKKTKPEKTAKIAAEHSFFRGHAGKLRAV